ERGEREDHQAEHEHAAAPEEISRPPAEQEQAGEGEGVGADHPLEPLRRESELVLDRGQRDRDDRRVEDDHEECAAEKCQRPPPTWVGCASGYIFVPAFHVPARAYQSVVGRYVRITTPVASVSAATSPSAAFAPSRKSSVPRPTKTGWTHTRSSSSKCRSSNASP